MTDQVYKQERSLGDWGGGAGRSGVASEEKTGKTAGGEGALLTDGCSGKRVLGFPYLFPTQVRRWLGHCLAM